MTPGKGPLPVGRHRTPRNVSWPLRIATVSGRSATCATRGRGHVRIRMKQIAAVAVRGISLLEIVGDDCRRDHRAPIDLPRTKLEGRHGIRDAPEISTVRDTTDHDRVR